VRFTKVVEKAGEPEAHLVLVAPGQDRVLRTATKEHRVMTLFQETVGQKTDRGIVGFEAGTNRQFLIFPKSLRAFEGKQVVGIKYELIKVKEVPKSQRAAPPKEPRPPKKPQRVEPEEVPQQPAREVAKEETEERRGDRRSSEISEIKRKVRRAMKMLEQGKAVAAFNLLKEIVEE
jgi:hypothetical protein